jgi:hypothetical protein
MNTPTTPSAANSLPERPSGKTNVMGSAASPCWAALPCPFCGNAPVPCCARHCGHDVSGAACNTPYCVLFGYHFPLVLWDNRKPPNAKISGPAPEVPNV